jgi:hypothetical protein
MTYVVETQVAPGQWEEVRAVTGRFAADQILAKLPEAKLPARIKGVPDGEVLAERAVKQIAEAKPDPLQHIVDRAKRIADEKALMEEDIHDASKDGHSNRMLAVAAGISPPSIPAIIERVAQRRAAQQKP